jgi:regulator of sigma E protease
MDWIITIVQTVAIFAAALFILVLVHELGHFLAAKLFGMRVDRFSIGFPPRVAGKKIGDTDYCISATPLGGYVKIAGMIDETMDADFIGTEPQPWEFRSKPVWQRIIVISAGVIFNVLLAAVIYAGLAFTYGTQHIPAENVQQLYIPDGSLADKMGFEPGDRILTVNDREPETYGISQLITLPDITRSDLRFTVDRNGKTVHIEAPEDFMDQLSRDQEFLSIQNALPSKTSSVIPGTPADEAGLQAGDEFVAINGENIEYWMQLSAIISNSEGELVLTVRRDGEIFDVQVTPNPDTRTIGIYPVDPFEFFGVEYINHGFFSSMYEGARMTYETSAAILTGFGRMLTGSISVRDNLGGPVAIASVTKEVTDQGGFFGFWMITAFLSISLAIINILPIPVLDGGYLVFLAYEGITRREPSVKVRMALQQIGLILIIGLFIFVTFNDIMRHIVN